MPSNKEFEKLVKQAEREFKKMLNSGKVKDLDKARSKIMKKFGVFPFGGSR